LIGLVDYGNGNIGSLVSMLEFLGQKVVVSNTYSVLSQSRALILPGVGNFSSVMNNLERTGLSETITELVQEKKIPTLGVCLGMHLLTNYSEEGGCKGLSFVDAIVKKIPNRQGLKVPHMGWSDAWATPECIWFNRHSKQRFYFCHSYFVELSEAENLAYNSHYHDEFCSGFLKENILGVQFHPEKSHKYGVNFFNDFLQFCDEL